MKKRKQVKIRGKKKVWNRATTYRWKNRDKRRRLHLIWLTAVREGLHVCSHCFICLLHLSFSYICIYLHVSFDKLKILSFFTPPPQRALTRPPPASTSLPPPSCNSRAPISPTQPSGITHRRRSRSSSSWSALTPPSRPDRWASSM